MLDVEQRLQGLIQMVAVDVLLFAAVFPFRRIYFRHHFIEARLLVLLCFYWRGLLLDLCGLRLILLFLFFQVHLIWHVMGRDRILLEDIEEGRHVEGVVRLHHLGLVLHSIFLERFVGLLMALDLLGTDEHSQVGVFVENGGLVERLLSEIGLGSFDHLFVRRALPHAVEIPRILGHVADLRNPRWVDADYEFFDVGKIFGCVLHQRSSVIFVWAIGFMVCAQQLFLDHHLVAAERVGAVAVAAGWTNDLVFRSSLLLIALVQ